MPKSEDEASSSGNSPAMNPLTPYPITSIGCFLGFVLAVVPLPLQFQSSNVGVFMYGTWVALYNLQMFVNSIIWHDNVNIVAPVWCDIVTRIQYGASAAIRGCTLAICIRLYKITRSRTSDVANTRAINREAILLDLSLTLGIPVLIVGLYVIVQPFRFQILEEIGCQAASFSFVAYILQYLPESVFSVTTLCLAFGTTRVFLAHRKEMNEFLSSDPSMSTSKYKRLIIIAFLDTVVNVPSMVVNLCETIISGSSSSYNYPYISWDNVHNNVGGLDPGTSLGTILQTPASEWSSVTYDFFLVKWDEWIYVFHALAFFAVFGTTPEMIRRYRTVFWFMSERLGYKRKVKDEQIMSEIMFGSGPAGDVRGGMSISFNPTSAGTGVYSNVSVDTHATGVTSFYTARSVDVHEELGTVATGKSPSLKLKTESSSVSASASGGGILKVEDWESVSGV